MGIFEIVELVEKVSSIVPYIISAVSDIKSAIEDAKDLDPSDKEELIKRIEAVQKKVVSWDEL